MSTEPSESAGPTTKPSNSSTPVTEQPQAASRTTYLQNANHGIQFVTGTSTVYDGKNVIPEGKVTIVYDENNAMGPDGDIYPAICYVHPTTHQETSDNSSTN